MNTNENEVVIMKKFIKELEKTPYKLFDSERNENLYLDLKSKITNHLEGKGNAEINKIKNLLKIYNYDASNKPELAIPISILAIIFAIAMNDTNLPYFVYVLCFVVAVLLILGMIPIIKYQCKTTKFKIYQMSLLIIEEEEKTDTSLTHEMNFKITRLN